MALSVMIDVQGPDWPLGLIIVPTPSTPVNIMSLVDSTNKNNPNTANQAAVGATPTQLEFTPRFSQIQFQGVKSNAGTGTVNNTGNIYICRVGVQGLGNRTDFGAIVKVLAPGETYVLASNLMVGTAFSPYRYQLDADTANDSCLVTGIV